MPTSSAFQVCDTATHCAEWISPVLRATACVSLQYGGRATLPSDMRRDRLARPPQLTQSCDGTPVQGTTLVSDRSWAVRPA